MFMEITRDDVRVMKASKNTIDASWLDMLGVTLFGKRYTIKTPNSEDIISTYKGKEYYIRKVK